MMLKLQIKVSKNSFFVNIPKVFSASIDFLRIFPQPENFFIQLKFP